MTDSPGHTKNVVNPVSESLPAGAGLQYRIEGSVAHIVFDRPKALNAMNLAMAVAFGEAIADIAGNPAVRALVLSGEGRAFMAGGDVAELSADPVPSSDRLIATLHQALTQMAELPIPVLASLHGAVAGAGMSLALAVDLALAADDVSFQMAYSKIGASPDGSGSWHLPRVVGLRKAIELTLLSDPVGAEEAKALGLVNWVVPAVERAARTNELAERLANGPVQAFGRSKVLLRSAFLHTLPEHLEAERLAFLEGAKGAEFREGTQAFLEKRPADFRNPR